MPAFPDSSRNVGNKRLCVPALSRYTAANAPPSHERSLDASISGPVNRSGAETVRSKIMRLASLRFLGMILLALGLSYAMPAHAQPLSSAEKAEAEQKVKRALERSAERGESDAQQYRAGQRAAEEYFQARSQMSTPPSSSQQSGGSSGIGVAIVLLGLGAGLAFAGYFFFSSNAKGASTSGPQSARDKCSFDDNLAAAQASGKYNLFVIETVKHAIGELERLCRDRAVDVTQPKQVGDLIKDNKDWSDLSWTAMRHTELGFGDLRIALEQSYFYQLFSGLRAGSLPRDIASVLKVAACREKAAGYSFPRSKYWNLEEFPALRKSDEDAQTCLLVALNAAEKVADKMHEKINWLTGGQDSRKLEHAHQVPIFKSLICDYDESPRNELIRCIAENKERFPKLFQLAKAINVTRKTRLAKLTQTIEQGRADEYTYYNCSFESNDPAERYKYLLAACIASSRTLEKSSKKGVVLKRENIALLDELAGALSAQDDSASPEGLRFRAEHVTTLDGLKKKLKLKHELQRRVKNKEIDFASANMILEANRLVACSACAEEIPADLHTCPYCSTSQTASAIQ